MNRPWRDRIAGMESTPPAGAWENIAQRLENDHYSWKNKIYETALTPPANTWQHIEAALDEDDQKETAPVIPFYRKYIRVAAAAAVMLVLSISGFLLLRNKNTDLPAEIVKTNIDNPPVHAETNINHLPAVAVPEINDSRSVAVNNHPVKQPVIISASIKRQVTGKYTRKIPAIYASMMRPLPLTGNHDLAANIGSIRNSETLLADRSKAPAGKEEYITVTDAGGHTFTVSKKLGTAIRYLDNNAVSNESYLDFILRESDVWKIKFKQWRDKMLSSSLIPSADNFLDIIDFAKTISEER